MYTKFSPPHSYRKVLLSAVRRQELLVWEKPPDSLVVSGPERSKLIIHEAPYELFADVDL